MPCLTNVCVIGQPGEDVSVYHPDSASKDQESENLRVLPEINDPRVDSGSIDGFDKQGISPRPVTWPSSTICRFTPGRRHRSCRTNHRTGCGRTTVDGAGDGHRCGRNLSVMGLTGTGLGGRVRVEDVASAGRLRQLSAALRVPLRSNCMNRNLDRKTQHHPQGHCPSDALLFVQYGATDKPYEFRRHAILDLRRQLTAAAADGLTGQGYPWWTMRRPLGTLSFMPPGASVIRPAMPTDDEKMTYFRHVHLGVAGHAPGLMVPRASS